MIKNLDLLKEVSFNKEKDLQEANRMLIEVQNSDLSLRDKELKTKVLKDIIRNIKEVF
ncbi:hypothetical protein B0F89_10170 [Malaciobacter marinus]|jgi:hypothetical protein|uniref:Uncharacterized protein n=1 Tax=Malaciobacter marinus TaxID=505249 RepID=A0AB37A122_9BACT|nr:hypothetical protein [Malaciobacter marinus]PPK62872.1 hypothetical protein B0F89_10170 [Malaciobacter marinus]